MKVMSQFMAKPLPSGFYNSDGWHKSLINHYADNNFTKDILKFPLEALTVGIENIINVYGDFPEDVAKLLKQAVDPLFSPQEYEEKIYRVIKDDAIKRKDPYIDRVAEGLYFIRLIFEKNHQYLEVYFEDEISKVHGISDQEKLENFANELSMIAKVHARQISNMILQYCTKAA
jgi:hypothetical protein